MMLSQIEEYSTKINDRIVERDLLIGQCKNVSSGLVYLDEKYLDTEQAQLIVQQVAQKTQEQLEFHISEIVTLALEAIFDDPYKFKINFNIKRGKTEAELLFIRNGEEFNPLTASGGGAVDIASFALRIALWNIQEKKTRSIIILDEPFRFLSQDLQPKASEMIKMISEKLGIQIIMVTHNQELINNSDKVFEVKNKKGISTVEVR